MTTRNTSRGFAGALSVLAVCGILASCGGERGRAGGNGKLNVVATTTMIADMVSEIGGEQIELKGLMGPGVDPHLYEPIPADGIALREADVIFYNGLFLEGQMTSSLERKGPKSHALGDAIPESALKGGDEHPDPHVWGDVSLWANCIPIVVDALSAADAANAKLYAGRGEALAKQFDDLHAWAKARAAEVPSSGRTVVTSHDAFEYFGEAYGFEVVALQGISTVTEVGISERVKMVDHIKEHGVKAIFVESSVNPAAIESIAEDSGVAIGGELFSDAMGEPGEMGDAGGEKYDKGTYTGMIKHNINTVVEALK